MLEVLRESASHWVELDEDTSQVHQPHRSWGTYRVVDRRSGKVVFSTPNRDKAFGAFELLTDTADSSANAGSSNE